MPNSNVFRPVPAKLDVENVLPEDDSLVIGVNAKGHVSEHIAGVRGFNRRSGPGVMGVSQKGEGILGSGDTNGVHGRSKASEHSGVWGENIGSGIGVAGSSEQGIGIVGIGGTLAGFFEGNVEVTGFLTVRGAEVGTLVQLLQQLEQRVADVERRLSTTTTGGGATTPPPSPPTPQPLISVSSRFNTTQSSKDFTVSGSGFTPNAGVILSARGQSRSQSGNPYGQNVTLYADSRGVFSETIGLLCNGQMTYEFTARDDATGKSSNTVGESC